MLMRINFGKFFLKHRSPESCGGWGVGGRGGSRTLVGECREGTVLVRNAFAISLDHTHFRCLAVMLELNILSSERVFALS